MITEEQKVSEKEAVISLIKRLRIDASIYQLSPPDPDFALNLKRRKIGVEVTEYYSSQERKQFEEAWLTLKEEIREVVFNVLPPFSISFSFQQLLVPSTKERPIFVKEIVSFLEGVSHGLKDSFESYDNKYFENHKFILMSAYIKKVRVRKIHASYIISCLDVSMGWVGVSQENLLNILYRKNKAAHNYKGLYDEIWLAIVAGEGENISSQMGHVFHYTLPKYHLLSKELYASLFHKVYIYNDIWGYPLVEWNRKSGWVVKVDENGKLKRRPRLNTLMTLHQTLRHLLQRMNDHTPQHRYQRWAWDFLLFGVKQAWACLFGGLLLFLIIVTKYAWPEQAGLARYDFLFIAALAIQLLLIALKLETWEEAKVIFIFHAVGTVMEIFKTAQGSWVYPEENLIRIGGVPLFSGFMYASVGSYIARVTRIFRMSYSNYPSGLVVGLIAALIYINFFTHHYMPDIRGFLFMFIGAVFGRTWVYFTPGRVERRMPLLIGFCLVAFFIWLGENIATYTSIWLYPSQEGQWKPVGFGKLGSWFLLRIVSFALVSIVHRPRTMPSAAALEAG